MPPTASPKRMARSTAPRFTTGSTPGSAISTALACVLGGAPNAVDAPENIFDAVESCAWVSSPMTISQFMARPMGTEARLTHFAWVQCPSRFRCQSVARWYWCATLSMRASAK